MYKVQEPNLFKYNKQTKSFDFNNNLKDMDYLDSNAKIEYFIDKIIFHPEKKSGISKKLNNGTIGLVSKFGSGKTFFMQQMFYHLFHDFTITHPQYHVYPIYIDISKYENNFDRLLLLIFAEITKSVQALTYSAKGKEEKKVRDFLAKIKKILPIVAKTAGSLYAKKLTNTEELISLAGNVSEALGEYLIETLDEEEYYKNRLASLSKDSPMIIMIDNLDRCRPEFVLDFFVLIKRMFSVDNILFIVSYDKQQVINLLKTLYSDNVDISSYLRKYIAFEFYLPQDYDIGNFTEKYCNHLKYDKYQYQNNKTDIDLVLTLWTNLYAKTHLSLRQHQHGISLLLKIYEATLENPSSIHEYNTNEHQIIVLLIYLKITYPYEYQNLYYFILWQDTDLNTNEIEKILNPLQKDMFNIDIKNVINILKFNKIVFEEVSIEIEKLKNDIKELEKDTNTNTVELEKKRKELKKKDRPLENISDIINSNEVKELKNHFEVIELQKENLTYSLSQRSLRKHKG